MAYRFQCHLKIIKYLDRLDKSASKTKSVNTIIKEKIIYGFNTDYLALRKIIKNEISKIKSATVIGNGSTSRTAFVVLKIKCKKNFFDFKK